MLAADFIPPALVTSSKLARHTVLSKALGSESSAFVGATRGADAVATPSLLQRKKINNLEINGPQRLDKSYTLWHRNGVHIQEYGR